MFSNCCVVQLIITVTMVQNMVGCIKVIRNRDRGIRKEPKHCLMHMKNETTDFKSEKVHIFILELIHEAGKTSTY